MLKFSFFNKFPQLFSHSDDVTVNNMCIHVSSKHLLSFPFLRNKMGKMFGHFAVCIV